MRNVIEELENDLQKAKAFESLLIHHATDGSAPPSDYEIFREFFINSDSFRDLTPDFVKTNRTVGQFWSFIKGKYRSYAERREYIYSEFSNLFEYLEGRNNTPSDTGISDGLRSFSEDGVHTVWTKALKRRHEDPDGAITLARTLLETVCKHILDEIGLNYGKNPDMSELYKLVSKELNLSNDQHSEVIFKQILGGCSSIVNGLGLLRNRLGDSHGKSRLAIKPAPRHAELAVNLAGSMSLFLVSTWDFKKKDQSK